MPMPIITTEPQHCAHDGRECFYCHQPVGSPHAADCIVPQKRIRVRYLIELEIDVPHYWQPHDVEFHRGESSWCAGNAIQDLQSYADTVDGCLCAGFSCEFISTIVEQPFVREQATA